MENLKRKLQFIREGYIYENEESLNESVGAAVALISVFSLAIAAIGYIGNKSERDAAKSREAAAAKTAKEKQIMREKYLKTISISKLEDNIKADIKKIVNKLSSNEEVKKKIEKKLSSQDDKKYALVYNDEGDYIEIISGSQEVNSTLHWIIEDVAKAIKAKYNEPYSIGLFKITTGDGDEGSIYLEMKE